MKFTIICPFFLKELRQYVDEYAMVYDSTEEGNWRLVINEVTTFIEVCQMWRLIFWVLILLLDRNYF